MPPVNNLTRIEVYEGALTSEICKKSSVEIFHDFYYSIKEVDKRRLITEVVGVISDFKSARKKNSPKANQNNILEDLYSIISSATGDAEYRKCVAQRDSEEVFTAICSIMKNRSGLFKAEYPETLKYIVHKYSAYIFNTDRTRNILRCAAPKQDLKVRLDLALDNRTVSIKNVEKTFANIRIKNTLLSLKEKLDVSYPERKYRYLIAQILEQVSNHFEVVPTSIVSNYYEGKPLKPSTNLSKEDAAARVKAISIMGARNKEFTFREELPKNGTVYSADDIEKQDIKNLKLSIEKRYGSCSEITRTLIVALLINDGLPDYIKNNVCAFNLKHPDDHVMVGIKDFEGKILILDAWLRHTNLKATYGYRPEHVKSYDRDRKTGFMGDIDSYSDFLNAHESGHYVLQGNKHVLVEKNEYMTTLKKNINALGSHLDSELAKAQPNQLYSN